MNKFLHKQPVHAFLIGFYFISFIFVQNIRQVVFPMTYRSILVDLCVTALIFGISYIFYRSSRKAGIFTTLLILGFFIYGSIYNGLESLFYKGYWPFSHIHRFLIFSYFLFYLGLYIFLYRSPRPHFKVNYLVNIFVLTLLIANYSFLIVRKKNHYSASVISNPYIKETHLADSAIKAGSRPDVYYIILDGYASENTLKKFYDDKNPILFTYLRSKGFFVTDSSCANYPSTNPSLSSSLNMEYLNDRSSDNLIRQNRVSYIFKKAGYRNVNIESGYAVSEKLEFTDKTISITAPNEFENRLIELTVLRLDDILGFTNYLRVKSELNNLNQVADERGPKFSFIHIVCPHPPYVVDENGKRKFRNSLSDNSWEPRKDYKGQLQYVSKRIMKFLDGILQKPGNKPIIILQGDHGSWISDKDPLNVYNARIGILNAYYVPESYKSKLYNSISPVNSFRFLFSELFHLNYPLLPDNPYPYDSLKKTVTFGKYLD
jgi:hypothetical protein